MIRVDMKVISNIICVEISMPKVKRRGHSTSWGDKIKPIPVPDEDHPPFANPKLPAHEFTWGMIGPPGYC